MTRRSTAYRELVKQCCLARGSYNESELCLFSMGVGKRSNGRLLVVGRATNGWGNGFHKDDPDSGQALLDAFLPSISSINLDWVTEQLGSTTKYNPNKSAFWRLTRMLAKALLSDSDDCYDHVCWTNLYKVAPDGGNPSGRLKSVQRDICVEILAAEIEEFAVKNVVFLTGYPWAKPFLEQLGVTDPLQDADKEFVAFAVRKTDVNYVVAQHPQGKQERPHFEEIVHALTQLSS